MLANKLTTLPDGLVLQSRVKKIVEDRRKMTAGAQPIDWGYAENLAYATLINDGFPVRLSGQDCGRGTFFHRHAVLHNQSSEWAYVPLRNLAENQANFLVIDSVLSEEAVLAFEYGYATADPNTMVIWEAQFGDFANGAQVVIDQFICSGETKWGRLCGLSLFLPHGYEGQGPEHSSARLERFLQLCAEDNMQVLVPSTPAQAYHMIRRQMVRPMRRPLIVMTPKSLLRHRLAVSTLEDLSQGKFEPVLLETDKIEPSAVTRLVFCSGKVYYDLLEKRREEKIDNIAIVRVEQLYPFPYDEIANAIAMYPNAVRVVWCQEEPRNQGAWRATRHRIERVLSDGQELEFAGRPPSASPAVGYANQHIADATILAWQKKPGDAVTRDEVLVEVETDKVVLEVPAPADGVLSSIVADEGATVVAQELLGTMEEGVAAAAPAAATATAAPAAGGSQTGGATSPSVRNMMAEQGVDRDQVAGSGKGGRISKDDVQAHVAAGGGSSPAASPSAANAVKSSSSSCKNCRASVTGQPNNRHADHF